MASTVIAIEHRGDGIDAQTINIKTLQPVQCASEQKISHLWLFEIVDQRIPVRVFALAWIGVLEEGAAIEACESVRVGWEVSGYPVDDDTDTRCMTGRDEASEVLGVAVSRGRSIETGRLISPGFVERIFRDGH